MPGFQSVTLVALTGWGQDEDRQRTREAGFDQHLVKPVDLKRAAGAVVGSRGRLVGTSTWERSAGQALPDGNFCWGTSPQLNRGRASTPVGSQAETGNEINTSLARASGWCDNPPRGLLVHGTVSRQVRLAGSKMPRARHGCGDRARWPYTLG